MAHTPSTQVPGSTGPKTSLDDRARPLATPVLLRSRRSSCEYPPSPTLAHPSRDGRSCAGEATGPPACAGRSLPMPEDSGCRSAYRPNLRSCRARQLRSLCLRFAGVALSAFASRALLPLLALRELRCGPPTLPRSRAFTSVAGLTVLVGGSSRWPPCTCTETGDGVTRRSAPLRRSLDPERSLPDRKRPDRASRTLTAGSP